MKKNLIDILKKIKCFASLEVEILKLLESEMQEKSIKANETICEEGDVGDNLYVIESGEIAVFKKGKDGIQVEVATLQSGDIAGEMGLFGQSKRTATLRTKTEIKTWTLAYSKFQELLETNCAFSKALLTYLSNHLSRETSVVAKLISQDMDKRFKIAFFDSKPYMKTAFEECNIHNYDFRFFEPRLSPETVSLAAGFKAVCVFVNDKLNEAVIDELSALGVEVIVLRCAGYNNVDLKACERNDIKVFRVPAYSPYAVAEHAVALIMTLNRRIHRANNRVREGNFSLNGLVGFDLHGKTAGIIGAGKIGICFLKIMSGFGCRLLVHSRSRNEELEKEMGVEFVSLDKLLAQSDIISLHAPLTLETHHMINDKTIAKMKPGVMLINTSRGGLIDTAALIEGLKTGKIGYAGMDVYEEESNFFFEDFSDRVMADDTLARLTTFNNVMVTSHQAFLTREALRNIAGTTIENIHEFELDASTPESPNLVR